MPILWGMGSMAVGGRGRQEYVMPLFYDQCESETDIEMSAVVLTERVDELVMVKFAEYLFVTGGHSSQNSGTLPWWAVRHIGWACSADRLSGM